MYKKSPFMTALAALALVGVVAPDTALAATINKPTAATVDDCRAKGGDKYQQVHECLDTKLKITTRAAEAKLADKGKTAAKEDKSEQSQIPQVKNDGNVSADCQIWLCLPAGFPSGCESARKAYRKRLRKGKAPLPTFSSCAVGDNGQATADGEFTFREQSLRRIVDNNGNVRFERGFSCREDKEWIPGCSIVHKTTIFQGSKEIGSHIE